MKEEFLGTVRVPSTNEYLSYDYVAIVYHNDICIPLLRHASDLYNYDESRLQILLEYINENNLGTYSHCEFMTSEIVLIYFDNVNPKLLLELI